MENSEAARQAPPSMGFSRQEYWSGVQNFPQFIVIHAVKGFGIVNKAEVDVSLELSCFFNDPADVDNIGVAFQAAPGSQASSCLRKGTPLASRVAQGVSGPSSSCVWNPRVFADDAREGKGAQA